MYINIFVFVTIHIHFVICLYTYICMYTYIYIRPYICIYVNVYVFVTIHFQFVICLYVHTYIPIYIYVYIRPHVYTYIGSVLQRFWSQHLRVMKKRVQILELGLNATCICLESSPVCISNVFPFGNTLIIVVHTSCFCQLACGEMYGRVHAVGLPVALLVLFSGYLRYLWLVNWSRKQANYMDLTVSELQFGNDNKKLMFVIMCHELLFWAVQQIFVTIFSQIGHVSSRAETSS